MSFKIHIKSSRRGGILLLFFIHKNVKKNMLTSQLLYDRVFEFKFLELLVITCIKVTQSMSIGIVLSTPKTVASLSMLLTLSNCFLIFFTVIVIKICFIVYSYIIVNCSCCYFSVLVSVIHFFRNIYLRVLPWVVGIVSLLLF